MTVEEFRRLLFAPELIVLDVADAALTALERALVLEHPLVKNPPSATTNSTTPPTRSDPEGRHHRPSIFLIRSPSNNVTTLNWAVARSLDCIVHRSFPPSFRMVR